MLIALRVLQASMTKEIRIWKRRPRMIAMIIMLPLLFLGAFSILMGGVYTMGIDVALVVEEEHPGFYTNALIETLSEPDPIPPSLRLTQMDAETANTLFQNGEIQLVIIIPAGFEQAIKNNQSTSIILKINNAHEDMTKNLRMPVFRKLDQFYQEYLPQSAPVSFEYVPYQEHTFPRLAYMAWTLSIYSIMFTSLLTAGSSMTQEFENDTLCELIMSNQSPVSIYSGKLIVAVMISHIGVPLFFAFPFIAYGVWPFGNIFVFLSLTVPLALFSSSLGLMLGASLRNSVYVVPLSSLLALFYWFGGGGIAPLMQITNGLDSLFLIFSPLSSVYRSAITMLISGDLTFYLFDLATIGVFSMIMMIVAPILTMKIAGIDYHRLLSKLLIGQHRIGRSRVT